MQISIIYWHPMCVSVLVIRISVGNLPKKKPQLIMCVDWNNDNQAGME